MSDIEHHALRGGLDATLGYDEFASPTSSGKQLTRPTAIASRNGPRPDRRAPAAWLHDLEPAQRRGQVS
jgi:hypothetical protein